MKLYPRVLVITSCTGEKRFKPTNQLVLEDFKDSERLKSRSAELSDFAISASQMYTGQQHLLCVEGIQQLRQSLGRNVVDMQIFSAGYGLIPEDEIIVPYEITFNSMKKLEVNEWAKFLDIHHKIEKAIVGYDLIFVLLGNNYLRAIEFPIETSPAQTLIFLASESSASYIQDLAAKTFILSLSKEQAKQYHYGLVGLKGFLFKQFAEKVVKQPQLLEDIYQNPEEIEEVFSADYIQLELPLEAKKRDFN